jgi:transcriptional regulator with XRE-family HTH domain
MTEHEKKRLQGASRGLKKAREDRGLSQADLAKLVGVGVKSIARWEQGKTRPYPYCLGRLANALDVTQEEVLRLIEESQDPDEAEEAPDGLWLIPYPRNRYFTGREALLERLHTLLQTEQAVLLTHAITGLGGVGKTMLAVEYAYRYGEDMSEYTAVLWAPASSPEDLSAAFTKIAQALDLPEQQAQDQSLIVEAVKGWLSMHSGWLLILDNVEDIPAVQAFLPRRTTGIVGHILLTTRCQAVGVSAATSLDVGPLPGEEAAIFLLRRAKKLALFAPLDQAEAYERHLAEILSQEFAGLPLALDQAGAYIEETGCTLAQYLERYRTQRAALLGRRGNLVDPLHPEAVTITFLLSLARIEHASPAAADLLLLCAFLAPDAIPEDLFARGSFALPPRLRALVTAPVRLDETIALIRRYSLIQRLASGSAFSVHRLVQAVLQDDLETRHLHASWEEITAAMMFF